MNTTMRIGKSAPIHTTGSGKVLLSALPQRDIDDIINNVGLARLTKNTITDRKALMAELERVKQRGCGIDNEECEDGHKCVSVPIYDYTGSVAAAISAFDVAERLTESRIEKDILPALKSTAEKISYRLGFER